eukprot:CAMPEP_0171084914 /NCGR_PEP_ID=MMETSP0766_2-20121228/18613_1 /TAXON_ID=439317 /ORGANISM="Gambierdiscus australes, Strain CAWD 149" /LENGTH=498 /DNA_ID=CAMNT_0011542449 /DNA_START=93 /DNA_END=1589 /DNA_ORIENTATION=-
MPARCFCISALAASAAVGVASAPAKQVEGCPRDDVVGPRSTQLLQKAFQTHRVVLPSIVMPYGFCTEEDAFKFYDLNGDLRITAQELLDIHSAEAANGDILGEHNSQPYSLLTIQHEIAVLDTDGSGDLSQAEFDNAAMQQQGRSGTQTDTEFTEKIMRLLTGRVEGLSLAEAKELSWVQRLRQIRQNATATRKKAKSERRRTASRRRSVAYGEVHALYTFGAPPVSDVALSNGRAGNGIFKGLRVVSHDRDKGLLWGYWYKADPVTWLANIVGFEHPKIDVLVLQKFSLATPEHKPCTGNEELKDWPSFEFPLFHISLHYRDTYTEFLEAQAHWPTAAQMFRYASTVYYDQQAMHEAALQAGTRLVDYYYDHGDSVGLVQDESTLECTLVFQGSDDIGDWINNLNVLDTSFCGIEDVHMGFHSELVKILTSTYWQQNIRPKLPMCSQVRVTGHSLGGAIATLFAACANHVDAPEDDADHQHLRWVPATPVLMAPFSS